MKFLIRCIQDYQRVARALIGDCQSFCSSSWCSHLACWFDSVSKPGNPAFSSLCFSLKIHHCQNLNSFKWHLSHCVLCFFTSVWRPYVCVLCRTRLSRTQCSEEKRYRMFNGANCTALDGPVASNVASFGRKRLDIEFTRIFIQIFPLFLWLIPPC